MSAPHEAAGPLQAAGRRARAAAPLLAAASTAAKDAALELGADLLQQQTAEVLAANAVDLRRAEADGATGAQLDRLRLDGGRVASMASGLRQVAAQADPVGQVVDGWVRPNGLRVERVRVPLGVVGVIYENRPNVTSDAGGLCLKSGNVAMLRGSSSALETNRAVVACLRRGAAKAGLPEDAVLLVDDTTHQGAVDFMRLRGIIDCLVPRGGPSLLDTVRRNATVPTIVDGEGNCHVYVDRAADIDMALAIVVNAKTQRPSVCNAAESLLVHRQVAEAFLPRVAEALAGVTLLGDAETRAIVPSAGEATDDAYATEFLDLTLSVAVVTDLDAAVAHIARFGTGHSEAIVTGDLMAAEQFTRRVDAAAVLVNASTRFVDGAELGFGAEIGISTQKLHARGPMGLRELTCVKYIIHGEGQTR